MAAAPTTERRDRPITHVDRLWLHASFHEALDRRRNDLPLVNSVIECVRTLLIDPRTPGLNFEALGRTRRGRRTFSARINLQFRLILVESGEHELGLLHFDNHDDAYDWERRERPRLDGKLEPREPFEPLCDVEALGRPGPPAEEAVEVAPDIEAIRQLVDAGMYRYLAQLDDLQLALATTRIEDRKGLTYIKGGAGTGKTAVAIARMRHLAMQPELGHRHALYLCYNRVLRNAVEGAIADQFDGAVPPNQVWFATVHQWARWYVGRRAPQIEVDSRLLAGRVVDVLQAHLELAEPLAGLTPPVIADELESVLRPNAFTEVGEYLDLDRRGSGFSLRRAQREAIWQIDQRLRTASTERITLDELPELALRLLDDDPEFEPYRGVVLDEAQDASPVMIRLAKRLVGGDERRLFVLADPAQAIYRHGQYWAQREVIRSPGRNTVTLRRSHRLTRQLHALAGSVYAGDEEMRAEIVETQSPTRDGPRPQFWAHESAAEQEWAIVDEIARLLQGGDGAEADGRAWLPEQIGVLGSTWRTLNRVAKAIERHGIPSELTQESRAVHFDDRSVKLMTLHSAKGLDFPVVILVDFAPVGSQGRDGDSTSPEARSQLYVALTRSSYRLIISSQRRTLAPPLTDLDTTLCDTG